MGQRARIRIGFVGMTLLALTSLAGGTVGIGTIAFALLIGPICQYFMRIFYVTLPLDPLTGDVTTAPMDPGRDMRQVERPAL